MIAEGQATNLFVAMGDPSKHAARLSSAYLRRLSSTPDDTDGGTITRFIRHGFVPCSKAERRFPLHNRNQGSA